MIGNKIIFGVDPGTFETGWIVMQCNDKVSERKILHKGITPNDKFLKMLTRVCENKAETGVDRIVVEGINSYGFAIGETTINTCYLIGRVIQICADTNIEIRLAHRKKIATHICLSSRAKDTNIRAALLDKYGPTGTKKAPNHVYNEQVKKMTSHMWSALAIIDYGYEEYNSTELIDPLAPLMFERPTEKKVVKKDRKTKENVLSLDLSEND